MALLNQTHDMWKSPHGTQAYKFGEWVFKPNAGAKPPEGGLRALAFLFSEFPVRALWPLLHAHDWRLAAQGAYSRLVVDVVAHEHLHHVQHVLHKRPFMELAAEVLHHMMQGQAVDHRAAVTEGLLYGAPRAAICRCHECCTAQP